MNAMNNRFQFTVKHFEMLDEIGLFIDQVEWRFRPFRCQPKPCPRNQRLVQGIRHEPHQSNTRYQSKPS